MWRDPAFFFIRTLMILTPAQSIKFINAPGWSSVITKSCIFPRHGIPSTAMHNQHLLHYRLCDTLAANNKLPTGSVIAHWHLNHLIVTHQYQVRHNAMIKRAPEWRQKKGKQTDIPLPWSVGIRAIKLSWIMGHSCWDTRIPNCNRDNNKAIYKRVLGPLKKSKLIISP